MFYLLKKVLSSLGFMPAFSLLPLLSTACSDPKNDASRDSPLTWAPSVGINIDPIAITNEIRNAVEAPQKRVSYINGLCETSFYTINSAAYKQNIPPYNIMVFNMGLGYKQELLGIQYFQTFTYDGTTYGVWAFESGAFENRGDGGYSNWCMQGWHDHEEGQGAKKVQFTRPQGLYRP